MVTEESNVDVQSQQIELLLIASFEMTLGPILVAMV
jgi:hypothetical protein